MQVGGTQQIGTHWYDRSPRPISLSFGLGVTAPHSNTTRASYVVPASKRAIVTGATLTVMRSIAATTPNILYVALLYKVSGGADIEIARAMLHSNVVSMVKTNALALFFPMGAGDTLSLVTVDGSTGGSAEYSGSCGVTEISA